MQDAPPTDPAGLARHGLDQPALDRPGLERPAPAIAAALRHALRDAGGKVVLRIEPGAPHRRRIARDLLQDGALSAGGQVLDGPDGDLLLIGAEAARAGRLRTLVERLAGPASTLLWSLERDAAALLAYAAGGIAAVPRPRTEEPTLAGLDRWLAALPLVEVVRRLAGLPPASPPGTPAAPAMLRIEPDRAALAERLGRLADDPDLLDHAARRIAARLPVALGDAATLEAMLLGQRPARLHLPLALGDRPLRGLAPGRLVATLPLATAAEPEALAATAAQLTEAGIGLEIEGLDAAALLQLDLGALPPATLRLRWSPALEAEPARRALAALDPARLILAEAEAPRALAFAAKAGLALVERPA